MALTKVKLCNLALSKIGNERNQLPEPIFDNNTGNIFRQCDLHYEPTLTELVRMHSWNCCKKRNQVGCYEVKLTYGGTETGAFSGNITASSTDSNGRPVYSTGTSGSNGYVNLFFNDTLGYWQITYGADDANNTLSASTDGQDYTGYSPWTEYGNEIYTLEIVKPNFGYNYQFKLPDDLVRCLYVTSTDATYEFAQPITEWHIEKDRLLTNDQKAFILYDMQPEPEDMDSLFAQAFYTSLGAKLAVPVAGDRGLYTSLVDEFISVIMPEARRVNGFESNDYAVNDSEWLEATYTTSSSGNSYPPFAQKNYNTIP